MALKRIYGTQNVLEAAIQRIKNTFANGLPVYLSFSSGKDSLCMAHIVYSLILQGEISAKQLTVIFIDEEGLYQSMLEAAFRWRKKFLSVGAKFEWYCLEVRQCSTLDNLAKNESWITWEKSKRELWMREPPPFAITESPLVPYKGYCNYQTFCINRTSGGLQLIGLRATESIQRMKALSMKKKETRLIYPLYDWRDDDIWLYIKENNLEFPEIYIRLYEAGVPRNKLRLCSFFGDTTVTGLKDIAETEPELWAKIERRYPNAYLILLYYDSEMFRRQTKKRAALETDSADYKAKLYDILYLNTEKYNIPPDTKNLLREWRNLVKQLGEFMTPKQFKLSCEAILAGDPKKRTLRSVFNAAYLNFANISRKEQAIRDKHFRAAEQFAVD